MPLELNDKHVLAEGVHEASLDDVRELFGSFQRSDRGCTLFRKLQEYVEALRKAGLSGWVIIDGSFIMKCVDEPDDIDLVFVLPRAWDLTIDLLPYQYNLVSKRMVKKTFPFDVYIVREGSTEEAQWTEFFAGINVKWCGVHGFPDGAMKGLVRVAV